ncbi:MAG: hypothetical protein ACOC44_19235, partial [Promethearchaeia archaeon]
LKRGEVSKGFKASHDKLAEISDEDWDKFSEEYEKIMGAGEKREYKSRKGTKDPKGEVITSRSIRENAKRLQKKVVMLAKEYKDIADRAETEEKKQEALSHFEGLKIMYEALNNTIQGRATLPPDTEEKIETLKKRYEKIGKRFEKEAQVKTPEDEEETYDPEVAAKAIRNIRTRLLGTRDYEDIEGLWKDWLERKRQIEAERFKGARIDPDESVSLKTKILSESMGYRGGNYWKNYIASSLVRGFAKDLKELGENAKYFYMDLFGVETAPIFEYMEENKEALNEAAKSKSIFLFEEYAYDVLYEVSNKKGKSSIKESNFLSGLWDKVKKFGAPIVSRLSRLIEAGASWAKNLAEKGISWIASSPVAQVAVPAVVLAGSIGGAIALINKLRKKKGMKKLSREEQRELEQTAEEKEDEVEKYTNKMRQNREAWNRKELENGEEDFEDEEEDEEEEELASDRGV